MIDNTSERKSLIEPLPTRNFLSNRSIHYYSFHGVLFYSLFCLVFYISQGESNLPLNILLIAIIVLAISSHVATLKYKKDFTSSLEMTNSNIKTHVKRMYGVTMLEPLIQNFEGEKKGKINVTNAFGKKIQATIELIDNDTDVLVFSSGVETPRIN